MLVAAAIDAPQLPPAQIKAFAFSPGTRAQTDRIDAENIARFMLFRPEAGRRFPNQNLSGLRALTTRRTQIVDMRKRLAAQITARKKQGVLAGVESMVEDLDAMPESRIDTLERRIGTVIAQEEISAAKAKLRRSIRRIGPVSPAMPIAEMPEPGRLSLLGVNSTARMSDVAVAMAKWTLRPWRRP